MKNFMELCVSAGHLRLSSWCMALVHGTELFRSLKVPLCQGAARLDIEDSMMIERHVHRCELCESVFVILSVELYQ
jgi:hypothetical protein